MKKQIHKTKRDFVVDTLRDAILSGEIHPGERLLQDELAEDFKVSSTPIREALRLLEAEGILEHIPHKGVRVAEVSLEDVHEIYAIRSALEPLAIRHAIPNQGEASIQHLLALNEHMETHIHNEQLEELRHLNYEFHMLIYKSAGFPLLLQIIRSLWTKFPWDTLHTIPSRAQESIKEHKHIIQAIVDGNAELADQSIQKHIQNAATALYKYLNSTQKAGPGS